MARTGARVIGTLVAPSVGTQAHTQFFGTYGEGRGQSSQPRFQTLRGAPTSCVRDAFAASARGGMRRKLAPAVRAIANQARHWRSAL
jgi:hypothetical protein